jgi:hypothetical protein
MQEASTTTNNKVNIPLLCNECDNNNNTIPFVSVQISVGLDPCSPLQYDPLQHNTKHKVVIIVVHEQYNTKQNVITYHSLVGQRHYWKPLVEVEGAWVQQH